MKYLQLTENTNNTVGTVLVLGGLYSLDCGAAAGNAVWFLLADAEDVDTYICTYLYKKFKLTFLEHSCYCFHQ